MSLKCESAALEYSTYGLLSLNVKNIYDIIPKANKQNAIPVITGIMTPPLFLLRVLA